MITITKSPRGRYCVISGQLTEIAVNLLDEMLSCQKKGVEYSQKYKLGLWDGKIHMLKAYPLKNEYIFPAGALYDVCSLLTLLRIEYKVEVINNNYTKCGFKWKTHKQLYDYQEDILNKIIEQDGSGVVEMPTGAGKTLTAIKYAQRLDLPFMVLVHRAELFDQWRTEIKNTLGIEPTMIGDTTSAKKIRAAIKKAEKEIVKVEAQHAKEIGKPFPKLKDYPYEADKIKIIENDVDAKEAIENSKCCICMVQTLHSFMKDRKSALRRLDIPVLIVDECHTAPADTVFDVIYHCTCNYTLGLSATVGRTDGLEKKITAVIGPRVESMNVEQLVERKILARPKFYMLYPDVPMEYASRFAYYDKPNYQTVYTDCITLNMERNQLIADTAKHFMDGEHQIYIHVTQINHGEILQNMIPGSVVVFGTSSDRKQIIEDYRNGKIKCLISTLLKEGVSIPSIDVLIYAAGGKSEISTIQTIGRALRIKEDGRDAIVIDVYDAVEAYLMEHSRERIKTYDKFYGKLFKPKYIRNVGEL